jgi:hypothetical protein
MSRKNFEDLTYSMWENEADKYMVRKHGVGIDDIPDMLWHDWFMDDIGYEEAVDMAIEKVNEEGF